MKTTINPQFSTGTAIVIINIPPYGRIKLGATKRPPFLI